MRDWIKSIYLLDLPNRFAGLEGIRGLSVLTVFFMHVAGTHSQSNYYVTENGIAWHFFKMLNGGQIGVDIFFMLSGFLIARTTSGDFRASSFMRRRFARLLPAHVVVLTAYVLLSNGLALLVPPVVACGLMYYRLCRYKQFGHVLRTLLSASVVAYIALFGLLAVGGLADESFAGRVTGGLVGGNFLANLLPMQFFFRDIYSISSVTWTLCVEFAFYFAFAGLVICLGKSRAVLRTVVMALTVFVLYFLNSQVTRLLSTIGLSPIPMDRFVAFVFGVVLAEMHVRKLLVPRVFAWLSLLALPALALLQYSWRFFSVLPDPNPFYLIVDLAVFVLLGALLVPGSLALSIFARPAFRVFGSISYSFYLSHALVIGWTRSWFEPYDLTRMLAHLTASLIIAFALSSVLYYFLERPYMCKPRPIALEIACE